MIEATGLSKRYGDRWAIRNLNFSISKGDIVGLLGPNGAGKSTTMKILTGFMSPTEGKVTLFGVDVFDDPLKIKARLGYLPETPPLYFDMRVDDYLNYVADLKKVPAADKKRLIEKAIEKTHLNEVRKRLIRNLSKGFKQRVGIAQALVNDPAVLILDEPTVGLDPKQVAEIRDLIQGLKNDHTVILSTHILSEVEAVCNKIIILDQGHIVDFRDLNTQNTDQKSFKVKLVVNQANQKCEDELSELKGLRLKKITDTEFEIDYSNTTLDDIAHIVLKSGAGLKELKYEKDSLEDIFMKRTYNRDK